MFICAHCGEISSTATWKRPANSDAWAIGEQQKNGFHVRRIVWGLLMAQAEMRNGEQIRKAMLAVEAKHKPRAHVAPEITK